MPTPKNAINLMPYMFSGDTKVRKHTVEDDRKYD
jgi:hypothetical protein